MHIQIDLNVKLPQELLSALTVFGTTSVTLPELPVQPLTDAEPEKPKRGRKAKAEPVADEPKVEPVAEEPKADAVEFDEPEAEPDLLAEEPKVSTDDLRRVMAKVLSDKDNKPLLAELFAKNGYTNVTQVPEDKRADLMAQIKAAFPKA